MSYTSELNSVKEAVLDEVQDQLREDEGDSGYTEEQLYRIGARTVEEHYLDDADLVECLEENTAYIMATKIDGIYEPTDIRGALDVAIRSLLESDIIQWVIDELWEAVEGVQLYDDDLEELSI